MDFTTGTVTNNQTIPSTYKLEQNYPNPFNPSTNIAYELSKDGIVTLKIYDAVGKEVVTLVNQYQAAGKYSTNWVADKMPSGNYFYRLTAGNYTETKKMSLVK